MRSIALLLPLLLADCGGGGDAPPGTPGPLLTLTVASSGAIDGLVGSDGTVAADGVGVEAPFVGDRDDFTPGLSFRQFLHFDLSALPAGAVVVSAVLVLPQTSTVGDPCGGLGSVVVDHVDFGPALDAADFAAVALTSAAAVLSTDALQELKAALLGPQVAADVAAGRVASQFRLRFGADANLDGNEDYTYFNDGEGSLEALPFTRPRLVITYSP